MNWSPVGVSSSLSHRRPSRGSRRGSVISKLLTLLFVVLGLGAAGYFAWTQSRVATVRNDLIIAEASVGPFDHIVLEQGELESSSNVDVVCKVRARGGAAGTALLWVVDEGTVVKEGDKLVELDSSALETAYNEKRIVVIAAESAVAAAEAAVEQARISRQEYLEGLYQNEERLIQSEMAIAEQGLRKAQLALESTERLVAKGLVNSLQLEADQFAVANNRALLETAQNRLRVLQNLTRQKMLVQFDSAIDAAEAQLAAAQSALEEEQGDLRYLQKQIDLCIITAPAAGVVIHANEYSSRGGNAEFVVEPGAIIRERQTILRLPDPTKMQVRAKVNESRITLIRPGMPAKIRIDAVRNMELIGRVAKVNRYAEPGSWFSTSIKEYATTIEIVDPPHAIRTGMTAEVQIFVQQISEATQVPIQAIYEHGGKTYSLVRTSPTSFETREVEIGATNEKMATIVNGITAGDDLVLNLRQNLSLMDLPEIKRDDNTALASMTGEQSPEEGAAVDGPSDARGQESQSRGYEDRGVGAERGQNGYGGQQGGLRGAGEYRSNDQSSAAQSPDGSATDVAGTNDKPLESTKNGLGEPDQSQSETVQVGANPPGASSGSSEGGE